VKQTLTGKGEPMISDLEKLEQQSFEEGDSAPVPPPDIVAYNELRSCADLFRMKAQGILLVQPEFQREFVWKGPDQTRFIDSLVKQLPIPSMCFALDHKKQKWMVIDGLQRISTVLRFLEGGDWKLSTLDDIDPGLAGKSVAAIKTSETSLHEYYTRVENLTIPITVLRCEFNNREHMEYLFTIFHRLNTGGMKLTNQEIRNCIYGGSFNDLLRDLDQLPQWRKLNKMRPNRSYRFSKQELMLRFFAFHDNYEKYQGHLAKFLNEYMHTHKDASDGFLADKSELLERTAKVVWELVYGGKAQPKTSITLLESTLVGVGRNVGELEPLSKQEIQARYQRLRNHEDFSEGSLTEGLAKKNRVKDRLATAVQLFSEGG